jgi:hypothetical protein
LACLLLSGPVIFHSHQRVPLLLFHSHSQTQKQRLLVELLAAAAEEELVGD